MGVRDSVCVIDESKVATHAEPVGRERGNYIARLNLSPDGRPASLLANVDAEHR